MLRLQKLEFTHLLTVNLATNEIKLKPIFSISHMISAVSSGNSIPIAKALGHSGHNLQLQSLKVALTLKSDNHDVTKLLEILKKLIDVKLENPSARLPQVYLNVLKNHPGWNDLSDQDFEKAVLAKQFLMSFSVSAGLF